MGNGAKAQQKQQRNAKKGQDSAQKRRSIENQRGGKKHYLPDMQAELPDHYAPACHVENKHGGKTVADCFPDYKE
ncbi:unnamed protein product [Rhizoctonia solani]|uniref:Small EDRK-rich factor-like N-terminal domain-containing protein n=1 Tax=Rhizoctonia solani TaxID=456999 RepID=A0A8H3GD08_9AGAM|nr:unnamed protein product [Rhizoctonia solani]